MLANVKTKNQPPTPSPSPLMVRVAGAAKLLDVSGTTIRRWCASGDLPYGWYQGQRRIKVEDIEKFVERVRRGKL